MVILTLVCFKTKQLCGGLSSAAAVRVPWHSMQIPHAPAQVTPERCIANELLKGVVPPPAPSYLLHEFPAVLISLLW